MVLGRGTSGKVTGNTFTGGVGIYCVETREVEIENNALYNHEVGLWSRSARPRIVRNQFFRNALALRVEGSALPARLVLNGVQDSEQLLDNQSNQPLQATNNWWGNEDEDWIEARISGDVRWRPFLNFDPRIPLDFALGQNYPNPFNKTTQIDYQIGINDPIVDGQTMVELEVRTLTGGLVRHLVEGLASPGLYSVSWDGRDERVGARGQRYVLLCVARRADCPRPKNGLYQMKIEAEYLVLGSGIAGLFFALKAAQHGSVAVVTKRERREANTQYAQGGIAAAMDAADSVASHAQDTLAAGAGLCDRAVAEEVVAEGPEVVAGIAGDWRAV